MKYIKVILPVCLVIFLSSFAATEWVNFQSKEGRFSLKFPRQPVTESQTADRSGVHINMHMFIYDASKFKDDNAVYLAMYCDYPDTLVNSDFKDEIVDTIMKGSLQGMAESMDGKILSMVKSNYHDFPGRLVKMNLKSGEGYAYVKMYLVHNRMYMLEVLCDPKNDHNASIDKYFDSFALIESKSPPAKK